MRLPEDSINRRIASSCWDEFKGERIAIVDVILAFYFWECDDLFFFSRKEIFFFTFDGQYFSNLELIEEYISSDSINDFSYRSFLEFFSFFYGFSRLIRSDILERSLEEITLVDDALDGVESSFHSTHILMWHSAVWLELSDSLEYLTSNNS